jgi:hypothetical protein
MQEVFNCSNCAFSKYTEFGVFKCIWDKTLHFKEDYCSSYALKYENNRIPILNITTK